MKKNKIAMIGFSIAVIACFATIQQQKQEIASLRAENELLIQPVKKLEYGGKYETEKFSLIVQDDSDGYENITVFPKYNGETINLSHDKSWENLISNENLELVEIKNLIE